MDTRTTADVNRAQNVAHENAESGQVDPGDALDCYNAAWESVCALISGEYNIWEDSVESVNNSDDTLHADLVALDRAAGTPTDYEARGETLEDAVCRLLYDNTVCCYEERLSHAPRA